MKYQKIYGVLLGVGLFLIACGEPQRPRKNSSTTVLKVEGSVLSLENWRLRTQILELDSSEHASEAALFQMTKMLVLEKIALSIEAPLDEKYLEMEGTRIDSMSLRLAKINQIKAICQDDKALYEQIFVKESLMPRWLHLNYAWNENIHRASAIQAASKFGQMLIDPNLLDKDSTVQEYWLNSSTLEPIIKEKKEDKRIDLTQEVDSNIQNKMEQSMHTGQNVTIQQLNKALETLKVGQLHPRPLEWAQEYWILQLTEIDDQKKRLKVIRVFKQDYFEWLNKKIANVPIEVVDTVAWQNMLKVIPAAKALFQTYEN